MRRQNVLAPIVSNAWISGLFSAGCLVFAPLESFLADAKAFEIHTSVQGVNTNQRIRLLKDERRQYLASNILIASHSVKNNFPHKKKDLSQLSIDASGSHSQIQNTHKEIHLDSESSFLRVDIHADRQYWETDNVFVAEGNVVVSFNQGILRAEKIVFDRSKNLLFATGDVRFMRGEQYFRASYFRYNLVSKNGYLDDVYGVIKVNLLTNDLNINSATNINKKQSRNTIPNNSASRITLNDGVVIEGGKIDLGLNPFVAGDLSDKGINSWRFNSPKVIINRSGWKAKIMTFSNDPFNPSQAKLVAKNVIANENKDGNLLIKSSKTKLILEDQLNIPIGKRSFGANQENEERWILGFDTKDRDGLYIGRKFKPIQLDENYELSLQPQFLFQRAINEKTNAYPESDLSVLSPKVSQSTKFSDLIGMKAKLKGKTFNMQSELSANISSFNPDRFANGSRYWGTLKDSFDLGGIKDINAVLFAAYRYKSWNGSLGRSDIYTSVGGYVDKEVDWGNGISRYEYRFRSGIGKYQAEALKSLTLSHLWRASIFNSLNISYPIYMFEDASSVNQVKPRYSMAKINPGIILNTEIFSTYFHYEGGDSQFSFGVNAGPELTLGNFRKPFLDYTKVSIMPGFTVKAGDSPFKFDNEVDLQKISFQLTQQIYGPLLLSGIYNVNIDKDSDQYGKSLSSKLAILWERRSYALGIFYDINDNSGGLMFRLNGFDIERSLIPNDSIVDTI